ncbi:MAG: hypothetical protein J6M42_06985 [Clostridia bacterium]|nr:hypothetical protein [Clostridia bacterium]
MSRLTGEQLYAILGNLPDEMVTEALPLTLLGGAAAVTAATPPLYSLSSAGNSTAAKAGFGAWVAKGGWVALAAGVVAAVGIAVGAFLLGSDGFEWPTFPQGTETEETVSDESEAEEETEAPDLSYFQFPLTGADDTTSYVSITDSGNGGCKTVRFLVNGPSGLSSVLTLATPKNSEANIQIVAFKTDTQYGFVYMYERVVTGDLLTGEGEEITVMMEGYHLRFDKAGNVFFNPDPTTRTCHFTGNPEKTVTLAQYRYNEAMLGRVQDIRDAYNNLGSCEYTVLYRYVDGEETVNTPVESIPDFPFTIFNSYNQLDPES